MNKKKIKITLVVMLLLNVIALSSAAILGDVVFEDTYRDDRLKLDLVGYGIKKFLAIKVVGVSF